ncbi:MAG: hypothetical protein ACYCV7_05965 [Acidimicrobiales bacterium]
MTGIDDSFDLEMAAASLRADITDMHILLKVLVDQLKETLGDRLRIERAGGRFRKSDEIRSVQITMGGDHFDAVVNGLDLACTIGHASGGIRIRNDQVDVGTWIARLLAALQGEAAHSQTARQALENIVIGGQT